MNENPHTPSSQQSFSASAKPQPKTPVEPVSRAELEVRIAQRDTPKQEHHLTPDDETYVESKQAAEMENERRIRFIQDRLNRTRGKAKRHFRRVR